MPRVPQQQWDIPRVVTETPITSFPPARVLESRTDPAPPTAQQLLGFSFTPSPQTLLGKSARMILQEEHPQTPGHPPLVPLLLLVMLTHTRYSESCKSFVQDSGEFFLLPAAI